MYPYSKHLGLKAPIYGPLLGLSIYYKGTWSLWANPQPQDVQTCSGLMNVLSNAGLDNRTLRVLHSRLALPLPEFLQT